MRIVIGTYAGAEEEEEEEEQAATPVLGGMEEPKPQEKFFRSCTSLFGSSSNPPEPQDPCEEKLPTRGEIMCDVAEEAEDDMLCLATSYLLVQAIRFTITGILPGIEGIEEPELVVDWIDVLYLYACAIVFAVIAALAIAFTVGQKGRWKGILLTVSAMSLAWCFLWATVWMFIHWAEDRYTEGSHDMLPQRVLLAVVMSCISFACIWVLDEVEDRMYLKANGARGMRMRRRVQKAIHIIITSLSILVGFSWERCFDGAIEAVTSRLKHDVICKFIVIFIVAVVLIPVWQRHILLKVMELRQRRSIQKIAILKSRGQI